MISPGKQGSTINPSEQGGVISPGEQGGVVRSGQVRQCSGLRKTSLEEWIRLPRNMYFLVAVIQTGHHFVSFRSANSGILKNESFCSSELSRWLKAQFYISTNT